MVAEHFHNRKMILQTLWIHSDYPSKKRACLDLFLHVTVVRNINCRKEKLKLDLACPNIPNPLLPVRRTESRSEWMEVDSQGYAIRAFPGCIIQEVKKWQCHPQVLAAQRRCRKECELQSRHLAAVLQCHQKAAKQGGREYHPDIIPL